MSLRGRVGGDFWRFRSHANRKYYAFLRCYSSPRHSLRQTTSPGLAARARPRLIIQREGSYEWMADRGPTVGQTADTDSILNVNNKMYIRS